MSADIRNQITSTIKDAMRARDKRRLAALRLMMAELQRVEVDERIDLDDDRVLAVLDKMIKQRKDSLNQYQQAGRTDLVEQEAFEIAVIRTFLPQALSAAEITALIATAIAETGARTMQDMAKLMAHLRPKVQGRADMANISQQVKTKLQA